MIDRLSRADIVALVVGGLTILAAGIGIGVALQQSREPPGGGTSGATETVVTEVVTERVTEVVTEYVGGLASPPPGSESPEGTVSIGQSRQMSFPHGSGLNADEGIRADESAAGVDFIFSSYGYIDTGGDADYSPVATADMPSRSECEDSIPSASGDVVNFGDDVPWICFKTDEAAYGFMRIDKPEPDVTITYWLFES